MGGSWFFAEINSSSLIRNLNENSNTFVTIGKLDKCHLIFA